MKKLLSAAVLVLVVASCATGTENGAENGPDATGEPAATGAAGATPKVEAAPKGKVNVPKAGTYTYDYETKVTNASTPDATPRRSSPEAELTATVTVEGDVVTTAEKSTEGEAVATTKRRHTDDGIVELSFETKTPDGSSGCTFDEPITMLPLPLEKGELDPQPLAGEGTSCSGDRTVTVGSQETVEDADGVEWSTRKIDTLTEVRSSAGVTRRTTYEIWFSPDLGKEIRTKSVIEDTNQQGSVLVRAETATVLKSYPS